MTIEVLSSAVISPRSIQVWVKADDPSHPGVPTNENVLMQIYTGEILFDYNRTGSGTVQNDNIRSYIPYEDYTIQAYNTSDDPPGTVIGSLTGEFTSTTNSLAAVNKVRVGMGTPTFSGINQSVNVLILVADVAAMHASAQSLAYQVTVLVHQRSLYKKLRLSGDDRTARWV
jgi:hypothetical protein